MPDNFNRSTVEVDFEDIYHQAIEDDVVIQIYNTQIQSLKQRFEVQFRGQPVALANVPAAPTGQAKFIVTPVKYEFKQFFYSVQSGKTNSFMQVFFVDPGQAKPRLIDFLDIAGKTYGQELLRILANSSINLAVWGSLDKRNRATILNLSAKLSRETISDGTKLIKLVHSIDRTWLDKKHRERIFARVDDRLFQSLRDYPALYSEVDGSMHKFPPGWQALEGTNSFKTLKDSAGNIQLTFARGEGGAWLADIDLDDHTGLQHVADVLGHKLSGKETDPYTIHEILMFSQELDAEYRLT